jgi:hypothetical protein
LLDAAAALESPLIHLLKSCPGDEAAGIKMMDTEQSTARIPFANRLK